MAVRLSLLAALLFSAATARAQRPEERDARAVFSLRGQTGSVSVMRDYTVMGRNRVAIVEMSNALYVLFAHREGAQRSPPPS